MNENVSVRFSFPILVLMLLAAAWGTAHADPTQLPLVGQQPEPRPEHAIANELQWVRTGGPPGGLGYDIRYSPDDPNKWYVTDNFAGVHISTDNGRTWQPSNTGIPGQLGPTGDWIPIFCLTVDPHNPQTIWAGTDVTGHIYKSTDGGSTWSEKDNGVTIDYAGGLTFRGFTVDPQTSDVVYAMGETHDPLTGQAIWGSGTGGVIFKTTDGGDNWTKLWDGGIPSSLARYMWIDPRDSQVLYVSTGIFDRGAVGEGDPATDPFGGLGVLKSTDGGQTWEIQDEDNGLRMLYLGSLYMHPTGPDTLLAAAGHTTEGRIEYLESLASQGIASPAGIYRTTDGGAHWTQVVTPPTERMAEAHSSVEYCPNDPSIAYAGSDLAIYRSTDAGATWTLVTGGPGGWGPPGVQAGWPIDLQCDPRDSNRIFANNYAGGNFLSEDGGRTWRNASDGYTGAQTRAVAVSRSSASLVFAAARSGLWRSTDAGGHWIGRRYLPLDAGEYIPGAGFDSVAIDPSDSNHLLAGNIVGVAILESFDSGASWYLRWDLSEIEGELEEGVGGQTPGVIAFAPSNPSVVYAALDFDYCVFGHEEPACQEAGAGVLVSRDGGESWERAVDASIENLGVIDLAIDPTDAKVVYAATVSGLFKTTNGGGQWTELSGLDVSSSIRAVAIHPTDNQKVLAGVEGLGVYASSDGGANWQPAYAGLEPNGTIHDIIFDPVDGQIAYCTDRNSGAYRSTDGGHTWLRINSGLHMRSAMGLAISADGNHVYVATDGEGVFRLDVDGQAPTAPYAAYLPAIIKAGAPGPGTQVYRDLQYGAYSYAGSQHSLFLDLYLPAQAGSQRVPVLVYLHGGGWFEGSKENCPAAPFVQEGYAVACVDYRLAEPDGCPAEFTFPVQSQDVKTAVRWLRSQADAYHLDVDHFGVLGDSSGGHLAALLGTSSGVAELAGTQHASYSDAVQAVCDWFGPVDIRTGPVLFAEDACTVGLEALNQMYGGEETPYFYWTFAWSVFLGGSLTDPAILDVAGQATPLSYVDAQDPPFLVIHGEADGMVPIGQSQELADALQSAGVDVTFLGLPEVGHGYSSPEHTVFPAFLHPTLVFFEQNLKN